MDVVNVRESCEDNQQLARTGLLGMKDCLRG